MYQDVMVVGEPSMMGGEYGEEDERTISRVVNTQYADGPHGMMGHGPGPPGGPGGPPHMHQMGGHPFMQVPFEMGGPGPGPGGWGGGPPPQPPPGSIIMPQRPGSTSSTPHTPVSRIGTPMGGMPGDLAGKNILNSVDGSSGGNGNISV